MLTSVDNPMAEISLSWELKKLPSSSLSSSFGFRLWKVISVLWFGVLKLLSGAWCRGGLVGGDWALLFGGGVLTESMDEFGDLFCRDCPWCWMRLNRRCCACRDVLCFRLFCARQSCMCSSRVLVLSQSASGDGLRDGCFVVWLLGMDSLLESCVSGEKMDRAVSRVLPSFGSSPRKGAGCCGFPIM